MQTHPLPAPAPTPVQPVESLPAGQWVWVGLGMGWSNTWLTCRLPMHMPTAGCCLSWRETTLEQLLTKNNGHKAGIV